MRRVNRTPPARLGPGSGQTETVSAYAFDGRELALLYRVCGGPNGKHRLLDDSVGQVWELGSGICFGARDQAGKLMGLAAYGKRRLPDHMISLDERGRLRTRLDLLVDSTLPYRDIAHEIQAQTSRVLNELLGRLGRRTGSTTRVGWRSTWSQTRASCGAASSTPST